MTPFHICFSVWMWLLCVKGCASHGLNLLAEGVVHFHFLFTIDLFCLSMCVCVHAYIYILVNVCLKWTWPWQPDSLTIQPTDVSCGLYWRHRKQQKDHEGVWSERKVGRGWRCAKSRLLSSARCRADALQLREREGEGRGNSETDSSGQLDPVCFEVADCYWAAVSVYEGKSTLHPVWATGQHTTVFCLWEQVVFSCSCAAQFGDTLCSSRSGKSSSSLRELPHLDPRTCRGRWA